MRNHPFVPRRRRLLLLPSTTTTTTTRNQAVVGVSLVCLLSILLSTHVCVVVGFAVGTTGTVSNTRLQQHHQQHHQQQQPTTYERNKNEWRSRLYGMTPRNNNNDDEEQDGKKQLDIESARRQFESLVDNQEKNTTKFSVSSLLLPQQDANSDHDDDEWVLPYPPPPPPLTSIEKERRRKEMELLNQLKEGDDALNGLWDLWFREKGKEGYDQLQKVNQLMKQPSTWEECERLLWKLIEHYGIYYVEPINQLATLYYLQGKFQKSYQLCRVILQIKPWHFGCLSGIVNVSIHLKDRKQARRWARESLPNFVANTSFPPFTKQEGPVNPQRIEWVTKAVQQAQQSLQDAEHNTQTNFFGKPEEYYDSAPASTNNEELGEPQDKDAWQ